MKTHPNAYKAYNLNKPQFKSGLVRVLMTAITRETQDIATEAFSFCEIINEECLTEKLLYLKKELKNNFFFDEVTFLLYYVGEIK
jgi:hypothetical protein